MDRIRKFGIDLVATKYNCLNIRNGGMHPSHSLDEVGKAFVGILSRLDGTKQYQRSVLRQ